MHNLYPLWGQGVLVEFKKGLWHARITRAAHSVGRWPAKAGTIHCHHNRHKPQLGQKWWISWDAGTYFLEELILDPDA